MLRKLSMTVPFHAYSDRLLVGLFALLLFMLIWKTGALALLCALGSVATSHAQQPGNDGFQRHNGQMQVVRNGHARPMTRDVHLPTGATVTKDGFVVTADGRRTELREGQGCNLRGQSVAVRTASDGRLALAPAAAAAAGRTSVGVPARSTLETLFGLRDDEDNRYFKYKKGKKNHGKDKGRGRWKDDDND